MLPLAWRRPVPVRHGHRLPNANRDRVWPGARKFCGGRCRVGPESWRDRRPLLLRPAAGAGETDRRRVRRGRANLSTQRRGWCLLGRAAGPRHGGAAAQGDPSGSRPPAALCSTSAAGMGRSRACWPRSRRRPRSTPSTSTQRALDSRPDQRPARSASVSESVAATPDEVPPDIRFRSDLVQSSHPHRQGRSCTRLLDRWLPRLEPDGTAWLVVARHLGADSLAEWLSRQGWFGRPPREPAGVPRAPRHPRATKSARTRDRRVGGECLTRGVYRLSRPSAHPRRRAGALLRRLLPGR